MTIVSLKHSLPFSVIASEREATQLMMQEEALRIRIALKTSISWIASLVAHKDEFSALVHIVPH